VFLKGQGLSLIDIVSHVRQFNYITKVGADHDQIESLIANLVDGAKSIPSEKIADLTNQLFEITKSESIDPTDLLTLIKQKKEEKLRLEEELRQAEAILESKNVDIQAIEKSKHLENELNTFGLSIEDAHILVSILKTIRQIGYDPQKIIREFRRIQSLRQTERQLEENCKILESRISRCRDVLPLCEQIMHIGIGFPELVALHTAVLKKADTDKLPVETAGYRVMSEIEDYNTLYDMKEQLYDLGMQILTMKQILWSQNKAMMAVVKLQCYYGMSEEQILQLPLEMYRQKSEEDSYNSMMTLVQQGDDARRQIERIIYLFRGLFRSLLANKISQCRCLSPTLNQNVAIQQLPVPSPVCYREI
jgi:hypothetical protein